MNSGQKITAALLAILGLAYWLVFIPTSLAGAQNVDMLAIFEIDEYAQYPNALHMVAPAGSLYEAIHNFAVYQHYFYGYPFYFFSGLVLLIGKALSGTAWLDATPNVVAALRQMINVLPILLSAGLLTWIATHFKQRWTAVITFLLLLSLPGVVKNNFWWHPDSLSVLFIGLVYFFLVRDRLRFGPNWLLAAAACGVGVGLKYGGAFFVLAIPLYLFFGWKQHSLSRLAVLKQGALFVGIMAVSLVISNPLLLLPQERPEIIRYQILQFSQTSVGIITTSTFSETLAKIWTNLTGSYGGALTLILISLGATLGLRRPDQRIHTWMVLAWSVPYLIVILNVSNFRQHYLLPLIFPLLALSANLLYTSDEQNRPKMVQAMAWIVVLAALFFNTHQSFGMVQNQTVKEDQSGSIQFYQHIAPILQPVLAEPGVKIYRDWQVYFPAQTNQQVEMNWEKASYPAIEALDPDLILLDRREVDLYAAEDIVSKGVDTGDVAASHAFYADAQANTLPGYSLIFADDFGLAFLKTDQIDQVNLPVESLKP